MNANLSTNDRRRNERQVHSRRKESGAGRPELQKNVLPHLSGPIIPRESLREEIKAFCGFRPEFWAHFGSYDWVLMCQLFGRMLDVPQDWPNFVMDVQQLRIMRGIRDLPKQTSTEHNALADALWTREAWSFLMKRR